MKSASYNDTEVPSSFLYIYVIWVSLKLTTDIMIVTIYLKSAGRFIEIFDPTGSQLKKYVIIAVTTIPLFLNMTIYIPYIHVAIAATGRNKDEMVKAIYTT